MAFTYFFRDLQTLKIIRDQALPELKSHSQLRIWDAGCANGMEAFSLAIILRENMGHMYFRNVSIFATDIDNSNLFEKIISEGIYPWEQVQRIPEHILSKYFVAIKNGSYYSICPEIRGSVHFAKHDLLSYKPPERNINLILCKNVLLHFTYEEKLKVIFMFHSALADDGYFATEHTQKLPEEARTFFKPIVTNAQLFKKQRG